MSPDFLSALADLKNRVDKGAFNNENEFYEAFERLFQNELRHNRLTQEAAETEMEQAVQGEGRLTDWKQLTNSHLDLLSQVTAIHEQEEDAAAGRRLGDTLSARQILSEGFDGKRGKGIYLLGDEKSRYDLIGDLHSDPFSLMEVIKRTGLVQSFLDGVPHRLVFLGDYVDRGKAHLSIMGRLLALKTCFPERLFLLRGNHDGGVITGPKQVQLPYRKYDEEPDEDYFPTYLIQLSKVHPETEPLLEAYLNFFNTLGQLAFIRTGEVITMAVHGGIPRPLLTEAGYFGYLENLAMLTDPEYVDPFGRKMTQNLMWSDPYPGEGDLKEGLGRYYFTEDQFLDFAKTTDIHQILRGHEWMEAGFRSHFSGKVHTLFSSGQWSGRAENDLTLYPEVWAKWARLTPGGSVEIQS